MARLLVVLVCSYVMYLIIIRWWRSWSVISPLIRAKQAIAKVEYNILLRILFSDARGEPQRSCIAGVCGSYHPTSKCWNSCMQMFAITVVFSFKLYVKCLYLEYGMEVHWWYEQFVAWRYFFWQACATCSQTVSIVCKYLSCLIFRSVFSGVKFSLLVEFLWIVYGSWESWHILLTLLLYAFPVRKFTYVVPKRFAVNIWTDTKFSFHQVASIVMRACFLENTHEI
jgi:hypothetical protein